MKTIKKAGAVEISEPTLQPIIENKADKFKRLATKRVNRILKNIELTKNLANKSAYEHTDEQIETIISTINTQVDSLKAAFQDVRKETPQITF